MVIPIACARDPSPHRGLTRAILLIAIFNAVYVALLVSVWIPLAQSGVVRK